MTRRLRIVVGSLVVLVLGALSWEGYKAVGPVDGFSVSGVPVLPRADDLSMPHVLDILGRFGDADPVTGDPMWMVVLAACWFTLGIVAAGFAAGTLVGLLLAVAMQRFRLVERGLLPYVILSQTVPLVALAPIIVGWGGKLSVGPYPWQPWMSLAVISAYLAFFPVAVGMLRGLQSPPPAAAELMRSYAAGWWGTLVKLRLPASLPHLVPALRLAAASAVVGAVVGEISTATRGGIGRLIIEYSRQASSDPAKVYTAMIGAALLGLVVAGAVSLFDLAVHARRPRIVL